MKVSNVTNWITFIVIGLFSLIGIAGVFIVGIDKIIEWIVNLIPANDYSVNTILISFFLIFFATLSCFPVTWIEIAVAFQLGWICVPIHFVAKTLGSLFAFWVGSVLLSRNLLDVDGDDPTSIKMRAISRAMTDEPYKYAFLLRLSPIPASFKSFGAPCIGVEVWAFVWSTVISSFLYTLLCVYVGINLRDLGSLVSAGSLNEASSLFWLNFVFMLLIAATVLTLSFMAANEVSYYIEKEQEMVNDRFLLSSNQFQNNDDDNENQKLMDDSSKQCEQGELLKSI